MLQITCVASIDLNISILENPHGRLNARRMALRIGMSLNQTKRDLKGDSHFQEEVGHKFFQRHT